MQEMQFVKLVKRRRRAGGIALALLIGVLSPFLPGSYQVQASAQESRPADIPPPANPQYFELDHRSASQMDPADSSVLRARQKEISSEATFFGYDLNSGEWDYDQSVCPLLPDELVLHYRRQFRGGAQSIFTALVPRGPGRVFVVPVLYRNATPFQSATGSERSIAVFNRVVPADIAAKAVQPEGKWLLLALCYADIVYAHANVLNQAGAEVAFARAPLPTLHLSVEKADRSVLFTDRNAPGQYLVWEVSLNDKGRLTAATATQLSDFVARIRSNVEPLPKPLPQGQEPHVKVLPPEKEPTVKTIPQ
jgi:hypothetical protein